MDKNQKKLNILFTSDIHAHAMPLVYGSNQSADLGLIKYKTVVEQARKNHQHLIVLDNGDLIQGTPLATHYVKKYSDHENPMIKLMNQIGLDGAAIGNHEFNFGQDILTNAIETANFPWLAANILDQTTGKPKYGPPYLIKQIDHEIKIAIVGVTTHYIPNWESPEHIKDIQFTDAFSTLEKWVAHIQETEKPDVLIALYHGGFERDLETGESTEPLTGENQGYQMATEIDGIDLLLTGHQHREIAQFINDTLVIQPGKNGQKYAEIQLILEKENEQWMIRQKNGQLKSMAGVETDQDALNYISSLEKSTQKWLDQPIGYIEGNMLINDPLAARVKKHPFIQLIQDVQIEASGIDISVTALLNNDSQGFSKVVTMRDIVSNYMYPNTLTVIELMGSDILAALEKSAEYFTLDQQGDLIVDPSYIEPKPQHYNYDMWEGINYTINVAKPIGSRIENVSYHSKPLNEKQLYRVVMNNYRASGGGNYNMFKGKKIIKTILIDTAELLQKYFEKHKTRQATVVDNFEVVNN